MLILLIVLLTSSFAFCEDSNDKVQVEPWNSLLQNWITSKDEMNFREARVLQMADKLYTFNRMGLSVNHVEVSETDLYLLGAIEKLLHRVDSLEGRLKRSEDILYHILSRNNTVKRKCPTNYTEVNGACYYFSPRELDWKSASNQCKSLGGDLVEFKTPNDKRKMEDFLRSEKVLRGHNYWTGGLNPGLLWIWADSAQQIYEDSMQTIQGVGRCLKLLYKADNKSYSYYGEKCSAKLRYICKTIKKDN